ncbi:ATPase [Sphingobacteriaceae bacterium]|nr:ATPase [Sphingobacteriaceae bacterium]
MIKRNKEKEIISYMKQFPVVAIIGPRQSGKTTLAKQLYYTKKSTNLYFDLESPADRSKFNNPEYFLSSLKAQTIIIDEVQRMPELYALLRSLVDKKKIKGKYLLLGSASPHLIQGVSETLAGRIAYTEIDPFNLTEIYNKPADINKHWFRGGFPDAWMAKNEEQCFQWLNNFFRTFIERDLNTLFGVTFSGDLMFKLWRMLGHFHGSVWNAQSFAKGLDVSPTTINRYIEYLEGAFMLRKLPAYATNAKKRLVKSPKVYIRDSGVLNYLTNIHSSKEMFFNPAIGNAWEGYVLEQIIQLLPATIVPYFYRTHDGSEMDLVLVKGIKPIVCIEIKTNNEPNLTRGFYECLEDLKCKTAIVITPYQQTPYAIAENIMVYGLHDFLTTKLPQILKLK